MGAAIAQWKLGAGFKLAGINNGVIVRYTHDAIRRKSITVNPTALHQGRESNRSSLYFLKYCRSTFRTDLEGDEWMVEGKERLVLSISSQHKGCSRKG